MTAIHSPNSSIAGYLAPTTTVLEDDALDDFIHDFIQGITNLSNNLIRPQWQLIPPNSPDVLTNWISFGIVSKEDDFTVSSSFDPILGLTKIRNQFMRIQISFLGPNCNSIQGIFRDGINIEQNRAVLRANGYSIDKLSRPLNTSLLISERWGRRIDQFLTLRRVINTTYPILDLTSASATVFPAGNITNAPVSIVVNP
jgi:hypothetical protein